MADPNFAATGVDIASYFAFFDYLESVGANLIADAETARNTFQGERGVKATDTLENALKAIGSPLSQRFIQVGAEHLIRQMAKATAYENWAKGNLTALRRHLFDYWHTNSQTINDPEHTYDKTWSAGGSNTGDGTPYRLDVDEHGYVLTGFDPDAYTLKCTHDRRRTKFDHANFFSLTGTDQREDNLDYEGSGLRFVRLPGVEGRRTRPYLQNASWDSGDFDGTTINSLPGWTANSALSNYTTDTTNYFRATSGVAASDSRGLSTTTNDTIYATLKKIDPDTPYLIALRVKRVSTATGTVTLRVSNTVGSGGKSYALDLSTVSADTWTTILIGFTTGGSNLVDVWPNNWGGPKPLIQVTTASMSGTVVFDELNVTPMTRVGRKGDPLRGRGGMGQYFAFLGGATDCVEGDTWIVTDSVGSTRGVNAWGLALAGLGYWPVTTGGTETVSDV